MLHDSINVKQQTVILKLIINIFTFYFLLLVFLPPMHNCSDDNDQPGATTAGHNNENNHSDLLCSPFCGEMGCGIVIDMQISTPHIEVLTTKLPDIVTPIENTIIHSSDSIWHPPQA